MNNNIEMQIEENEKKYYVNEFVNILSNFIKQHTSNYEISSITENTDETSIQLYENEDSLTNDIETIENNIINTEFNSIEDERPKNINEYDGIIQNEKSVQNESLTIVVDRFEGNLAICEIRENEEMITINKNWLPENVKEGDVLKQKNNSYEIDVQATEEIENRIQNKMKNLFED